MKLETILVFFGGGIGSLMRYGLGIFLNKETIPYGTLTANVLGSLFIGLLFGLHFKHAQHFFTQNQIAFFAVGILGGFTTFSSFMYENLQFLYNEQYYRFVGYSFLSILLGFLMVAIGYYFGKLLPF
jgi:CrcB protein